MAGAKELWVEAGDQPELVSGEPSTLVLRGAPNILFLRGRQHFSPYEIQEAVPVPELRSGPVIAPVPKAVLAHWKKLGRSPEPSSLLRIAVKPGVLTKKQIKLKAGAKTLELEMEEHGDGFLSRDTLLFVYGDGSADAGPDIKVVDVGNGDPAGFEVTAEVEAGTEKRKLGLVDFLIKDPLDGKFRSARYGLFKSRTPAVKMVCPRVGANNLRVLLDDGNEGTPDELDITKLLDPAGDVTDKASIPLAVDPEKGLVQGEWDRNATRSRIHAEPPEAGVELGVLLLGENRIRILDTYSGEIVYVAHFLLYDEDAQSIAGTYYGEEETTKDGHPVQVAADHLLVDFKDGAKTSDMAAVLHALHLAPQGFSPDFRIVQASPLAHVRAEALLAYVEAAVAAGLAGVESGGLDYVDAAFESLALERYPEAMRADFNAGNQGFNNGAAFFFHHFYIGTFPAHRLIDHVRFGSASPPSVILEGGHFLNKTFILPSCESTLEALFQARNDNPGRKVAVFGHADASGTDVHNTQLSQFRADVAHALLIKDPDVWLRRIDGSALVIETPWGTRELQFMLKELGHYTGSVNGVDDAPTRQASRKFLQKHGLPDNGSGRLDRAARRQLIVDYMDDLVPTALTPADFHKDAANNPALFAAGEGHPLIPSDPTNPANRRVTFILRTNPPVPIDLTQKGAAAPYPAWIAPEPDAPAQGGDNPPFVVGCWDTGFGNTSVATPENYSGELLDAPNQLMIRGRRLIRPTLLAAAGAANFRVFRDGDLSGTVTTTPPAAVVNMSDNGPSAHGSSVMTCMASDGIGNDIGGAQRSVGQIVLGTGKDVKFRPLRQFAFDFQSASQRYRIMTSDPEVKVVSTSLDVRHFEFLTAVQQTARTVLVRAMINSGKLYFLAASNVQFTPAETGRRDVARTEGGFFAPRRQVKRSTLTGANQFRRSIVAVGATSDTQGVAGIPEVPTNFTFLGDEVSLAAPGQNIRALSPVNPGGLVAVNGMFIRNISGTSFATPMSAGIAAEMMLANPVLQQPANMPRVVEMMEATADLLPSLAILPAAQRGPYLPGAANADAQLVAGDLAGFRRVNFWKAVLAALNDGLPSEQQIPNPAGGGALITATTHFDQLTGRDHAATVWYGFEVRSPVNGCGIFLKRSDGSFRRLEDVQAALPQGRRIAETWRRAQDYKAAGAHPQAGFVLPAYPFTGAAPANVTFWFMTQFSAKREELARFTHLAVFPPGIDPSAEGMKRAPTLSLLNLSLIARMRNPGAITAPERAGNPDLARIAAHIQEFDDFVFHWTLAPGALQAFVIVHREGAAAAEDIPVTVFAVDAQGQLKSDFAGNVNITHTGTNGSTAGGVNRGVFINGAAAGASTAIALANGMATFQVRNHTIQNFRLAANDGAGHSDDGGSPLINVGPPGRSHGIRVETTHHDGRAVDANPPRVGDRLKYIVTILDDQERTKTNFTGRVELKVTEGTMGSDVAGGVAPFKRGVHVADAQADAFDAARFVHTFVAGDRGRFEFSVFHYTTGPTRLQVVHEALSGDSPRLDINGGAIDHFDFGLPAANLKPGNAANITLRARDRFGNLINDFSGRVNLSVQPPAMVGTAGAGGNAGVFILNTQTAADDVADFRDADLGAKQFPLTAYTAGNFTLRAVNGAVTSNSAALTVDAPAALASFGFEVGRNQVNGVQFPVTVIAQDAAGNRIPNFAAAVTLARVSGPAATPLLTPHTYVAGDNGRFSFGARANAAGALVLRASSGAIRSDVTITVT